MPDFNKRIDLSEINSELVLEMGHEENDQDVTQLEIDINSTSISNSQNIKKRQLVTINDNLYIQSIQTNELGCPFFEESQ